MRRVGLVLLIWLSSATATFAADATAALTPTDVAYLKGLGTSRADLAADQPTPAMLDQLHQLINDPATAGKPKARADAVYQQLDHIHALFVWCSDHPTGKDCPGAEKTATAQ